MSVTLALTIMLIVWAIAYLSILWITNGVEEKIHILEKSWNDQYMRDTRKHHKESNRLEAISDGIIEKMRNQDELFRLFTDSLHDRIVLLEKKLDDVNKPTCNDSSDGV